MPKKYHNKSIHNKTFLESLEQDYPEDFFDWKVTAQFYCALHRCFCVLESKQIGVTTSHKQNITAMKEVDIQISRDLHRLYRFSRQSRYDGFIHEDSMLRINKINYKDGDKYLRNVENECKKYYPAKVA